jgi:hypothetical protein
VVIADVVPVVIAGNDDHVLALKTVQVGLRRFEFLPVSLCGEVPGMATRWGL